MYQPEAETLSQTELAKLQLERLQATLRRIHVHNPHYVEHLQGFGADDIKTIERIYAYAHEFRHHRDPHYLPPYAL
jgi:phenylacetate-coenzyme A ligase PaaK-like adenylate-forming protein